MAQLVEGDEVPSEYSALVQPHVDSYDYFVNEGMQLAVESMEPLEVRNSQRRAAEAAARAAGSVQRLCATCCNSRAAKSSVGAAPCMA